jgi:hypothetical protein
MIGCARTYMMRVASLACQHRSSVSVQQQSAFRPEALKHQSPCSMILSITLRSILPHQCTRTRTLFALNEVVSDEILISRLHCYLNRLSDAAELSCPSGNQTARRDHHSAMTVANSKHSSLLCCLSKSAIRLRRDDQEAQNQQE